MKKTILLMVIFLLLNGCKSEKVMEIERGVASIVNTDWKFGVPYDALVKYSKECKQNAQINGCDELEEQLLEISSSFQSCIQDDRSEMCKVIIKKLTNHPIIKILPNAEWMPLPNDPFYFDLPTHYLDVHDKRYEYRVESFNWWYTEWKSLILVAILFVILALILGAISVIYLMSDSNKIDEVEVDIEKLKFEMYQDKKVMGQQQESIFNNNEKLIHLNEKFSEMKSSISEIQEKTIFLSKYLDAQLLLNKKSEEEADDMLKNIFSD